MNKEQRIFIRNQLRDYTANKKMLKLSEHSLRGKHLLQTVLFVVCIDSVFAGLSAELQQYVQMRYFEEQAISVLAIAADLSVSERTARNWDILILEQIAEHLAMFEVILPFDDIE